MTCVPSNVIDLFRQAGWFEGRSITLPDDFIERFGAEHAAANVLQEFDGLHVGATGAGIECARSDIHFKYLGGANYENGYLDDVVEWEERLQTRLAGVGELHHSHGELFIASDGHCFARSVVSDDFWHEGPNFSSAAESLLLGLKRSQPLLRPDQESIVWLGDVIAKDSRVVYRWAPSDCM